MCGIAGAIGLKKQAVNYTAAQKMIDKVSHRGPDDAGYLYFHTGCRHTTKVSFHHNLNDNKFKEQAPLLASFQSPSVQQELGEHDWDLFLGHRRLSIVDPTPAGHQPMSDLSKTYWVVFNGEIYNFRELKEHLRDIGYIFKTNTDTEVIIYSYIEWGQSFVNKLNGMFALAIYDNRYQRVILARDRYGIKPLYISHTGDELIFASEAKAISEYKNGSTMVNLSALIEYFTFQNIFTNNTLVDGIELLPAGHFMRLDLIEGSTSIHQYWDFNFESGHTGVPESQLTDRLDEIFTRAVINQTRADVSVGAYLSGGIDSGCITAIAAKALPMLNTFTVGFDMNSISGLELSFDERSNAEYMSYLNKTEHYEMVLKAGDMVRCMPDFCYHLEEPRVGQSYPNYYAAKLASRFVKVVLSGTGGDELFGGYPWRYYRAINARTQSEFIDQYFSFWQRLLPMATIKKLFQPLGNVVNQVDQHEIFSNVFPVHSSHSLSPEDCVNQSLYFEAKTFLHGLLVVEDKLSMAHGLESRVPFLDNELVDFATKLPMNLKVRKLNEAFRINENEIGSKQKQYFQKTNDGKYLLRKLAARHLPEVITNEVKQGFSAPDASWFKGESIQYVRNTLLNGQPKLSQYMYMPLVKQLIEEHINGKQNRRLLVWSLLNFEQWLQLNCA